MKDKLNGSKHYVYDPNNCGILKAFRIGKTKKAVVIDTFLRALSFNPSRIAGAREKIYADSVQKTTMSEGKSAIYAEVKKARLNGDNIEDIIIEIAAYNQRAKREGANLITSKSLKTVLKRSRITEE